MAFGTLEDLEGRFDLVIFAEPYAQYGEPAQAGAPGRRRDRPDAVLVAGTLEGGDPPKILVREVFELERAEEKLARELTVRIGAEEATRDRLLALRARLAKQPGRLRGAPAPRDPGRERDGARDLVACAACGPTTRSCAISMRCSGAR